MWLIFFGFVNTSSLAALICEDLARIDPCQEVIRAVGPDLVIAILMDSAQIKERWPARYATILADDPGCSVLTVTSLALVERATATLCRNGASEEDCSRAIGLWKDSSQWHGEPIILPSGYDAVVLSLSNKHRPVATIDGRTHHTKPQWSWHLTDKRPIRLKADAKPTSVGQTTGQAPPATIYDRYLRK